jgi:hypothetical protein
MKKIFLKKQGALVASIIFIILLYTLSAYAGEIVPNTFFSGDIISAGKMNANFSALDSAAADAINEIYITPRESVSNYSTSSWVVSEIVSVSCLEGELLTGCNCLQASESYDETTTNLGFTVYCMPGSDFVIGFSSVDPDLASIYLYGPPITVQAYCISIDRTRSSNKAVSIQSEDQVIPVSEEFEMIKAKMEVKAKTIQEKMEALKK